MVPRQLPISIATNDIAGTVVVPLPDNSSLVRPISRSFRPRVVFGSLLPWLTASDDLVSTSDKD